MVDGAPCRSKSLSNVLKLFSILDGMSLKVSLIFSIVNWFFDASFESESIILDIMLLSWFMRSASVFSVLVVALYAALNSCICSLWLIITISCFFIAVVMPLICYMASCIVLPNSFVISSTVVFFVVDFALGTVSSCDIFLSFFLFLIFWIL